MLKISLSTPDVLGDAIGTKQAREMMRVMAVKTKSIILQRTAKGLDANGRAFRPYSRAYYVRKAKSGRNPPDGKGNWLVWTGQLLNSIQVTELTPVSFRIEPTGNRTSGPVSRQEGGAGTRKAGGSTNEQVALGLEAGGREFMGVTKKEIDQIVEAGLRSLTKGNPK
jgi:hypothetical protein